MTNIPDGYGFVAGRSRANAKAILAAAAAAGVDVSLVQTVSDGYIAPEAAVRQYEGKDLGATEEDPTPFEGEPGPGGEEPPEPEKETFPDDTWKNADIKEWANTHGVDLGDATKKADMLAAISSADTKEE
jgi:hypothetical protein